MHELSIASAVVDRVLEFLEANEPKKLLTVRLAVGELSHVEADQLHFCYTAITQETANGEFNPRNRNCRGSGEMPTLFLPRTSKYWADALCAAPIPTLECPKCRGAVEPVEGNDCAIKTIQFVRV
jgi:hydrogenase nickel incorporation protein HypA/HybF